MRKVLCVAALLLAICCPAYAGEIPNPPAPQPVIGIEEPPPPPPAPNGDMTQTDGATDAETDALTEILFALLASFLP